MTQETCFINDIHRESVIGIHRNRNNPMTISEKSIPERSGIVIRIVIEILPIPICMPISFLYEKPRFLCDFM